MRVIDSYTFHYGTKLPFSEIPDRIHRFLSSQELRSDRFMYYFEDIAAFNSSEKTEESECDFSTHGCERILKDCPELGSIRGRQTEYDRYSFLTNLDGEPFPEAKLLPLMKKIHRRYGFFSTYLYYTDIDFFGETIPYEPALFQEEDHISPHSGLTVFRCALPSDNTISLSVDSLYDGKLRDTKPYYYALRAVLPRMRSYHETTIHPSGEEQTAIDSGNRKAAPILEECRRFFSVRLPAEYKPAEGSGCTGIAREMRSIAGLYGFSFKRAGNGDYKASKRTARNAVIYAELSITSNPDFYTVPCGVWQGVCLIVSFQGVGFKHELYCDMDIPQNKDAVAARLKEVFAAIGEFEKKYLPALDPCFAVTPDWFIPSDLFETGYGGYHY